MKKAIGITLLILATSLSWSQCKSDPYYHECPNSPMWSEHPLMDLLPMPTEPVGVWSYNQPFWEVTQPNNTRPFILQDIYIDPADHPEQFYIVPYCSLPQPALVSINCQVLIFWYPRVQGKSLHRLYFKAKYADDGTDATHTVLVVGDGTPAQ